MPDRSKYWCHGVDVHVQFTREYPATSFAGESDAGTPVAIVRNSSGTTIRQNGDGRGGRTSNWFHFAIPTPTQLVDREVGLEDIYLRGEINGQATIEMIHLYMAGTHEKERIHHPADYVSWSARSINESSPIRIPNRVAGPLVMCIKVLFENGGEVIFAGAGAKFFGPEVGG